MSTHDKITDWKDHNICSPSPLFWASYPAITSGLRIVMRALAPRWRVSGRKNIPTRGGVLLAPNHISDIDPPAVALSLFRPLWFMAKSELFEIPVLAPLIRFSQAFPVERGGADRAALRRAEELLKRGQAVVVFPEGQLAKDGELQPILPGVTMMALRAGVPIMPVGLSGTNAILPYGQLVPRPTLSPVRVHFGTPIDVKEFAALPSREARKVCAEHLEDGMRKAIAIARA